MKVQLGKYQKDKIVQLHKDSIVIVKLSWDGSMRLGAWGIRSMGMGVWGWQHGDGSVGTGV